MFGDTILFMWHCRLFKQHKLLFGLYLKFNIAFCPLLVRVLGRWVLGPVVFWVVLCVWLFLGIISLYNLVFLYQNQHQPCYLKETANVSIQLLDARRMKKSHRHIVYNRNVVFRAHGSNSRT